MRAEELYQECGDVIENGEKRRAVFITSKHVAVFWDGEETLTGSIATLRGDDWTRIGNIRDLGPVTKLDDLPTYRTAYACKGEPSQGSLYEQAILVSDLTNRCLVRDSEDDTMAKLYHDAAAKVATLTARVAELEGLLVSMTADRNHWKGNHDNQVRIKQESKARFDTRRVFELEHKLKEARAELATLRSQQVLGEELTEKQFKNLCGNVQLIVGRSGEWEPVPKEHCVLWETLKEWEWRAYLDPRPLPTLPAPVEEVPEVPVMAIPDWLTPKGLLRRESGTVVAVAELRGGGAYGSFILGINAWGNFGQWPLENFSLCDKPVKHPDGTIAPIKPTAELVAALKGGESQ